MERATKRERSGRSLRQGRRGPVPERTPSWMAWFARSRLLRRRLIRATMSGDVLTERGDAEARSLVRSHRLWESYMARHFELPGDHLHATAEQVEHYLGPDLQAELAAELDQPATDPHGKAIPSTEDSR